ncbi:MAG: signal peptide peptidase SppA [Gammaproteobacteria bacterium]|nr:signal peptide peptidase SppA [Gammaproteobacteria bacterium]
MRGIIRFLDLVRGIVLNALFLLFLFIIFLVVAAVWRMGQGAAPVEVAQNSILYVAPEGVLVEEYSGNPMDRAISEALGDGESQVRLRDLVDAMDIAAEDDRIRIMVLDLDRLVGGGPAMYDDLVSAVQRFQMREKRVIAIGDAYDQLPYSVAAQADEIYMHPMGLVFLRGYGRYRNYYKDLIERFKVDWNVFHAGDYKSFGEPYVRNDMSPAAREASLAYLNDLWREYQVKVEKGRGLQSGSVERYIRTLNGADAGGDFAAVAVDFGLVDELLSRDQMKAKVADALGLEGGADADIPQVAFKPYVESQRGQEALLNGDGPKVGVIVAEGGIVEGDGQPGMIASERMARQIRDMRENDDVKAVILRVNSGGGSAFASEIIQRELVRLQDKGIPLVVSMGSVAASGGYWISATADEIWAQPTTITGSIGVVAMLPTFERALAEYGVYTDGVGTTELAGSLRLDRSLSEDTKQTVQASVDHLYGMFTTMVAEEREMPLSDVKEVAQGRVWSGVDAEKHGLIDGLGGFKDAVDAARRLAKLDDDTPLYYQEPELSFREQLLVNLFSTLAPGVKTDNDWSRALDALPMVQGLKQELQQMRVYQDRRGLYATCFCELP